MSQEPKAAPAPPVALPDETAELQLRPRLPHRQAARGPKGTLTGSNSTPDVPDTVQPRPVVSRSLKDALQITEQEVNAYVPTDEDMMVGEALLSGASTVHGIQGYCGLRVDRVKAVLNNPVAMAWISRQVEALFKTRAAVIDAAVYLRAAGGDVAAAKLFYERMKILQANTMKVEHIYSGGVNITALPDEELERIVREKTRMLPAEFRLIEGPGAEPEEPKK